MKEVQAQFQLLDNYVKEYSLKINNKIPENSNLNINGQIGFRIINITEQEDGLIGEIELVNNLDITIEEENKAQIKIIMRGLFKYTNKEEKDKFEEMLKINGATTLSHLIRAYIHSNTALSGMPNIITPMVNFIQFFKDNENNTNK